MRYLSVAACPRRAQSARISPAGSNYRGGTALTGDPAEFAKKVAAYNAPLVDGYAPFCKHVFVPNFVGATVAYLPITPENEHLLKSAYEVWCNGR